MRRFLPVLMLVLLPAAGAAQFQLTVPRIMRGPENVGREPTGIRYSADGRWIYFRWLPPGTEWKESLKPYRVRAVAGAVPERLSTALADSLEPSLADGPLSPDRKRRVTAVRARSLPRRPPGGQCPPSHQHARRVRIRRHYLDQTFARVFNALELRRQGRQLDARTTRWLKIQADFIVRLLSNGSFNDTNAHRSRLMELLLSVANVQQYTDDKTKPKTW